MAMPLYEFRQAEPVFFAYGRELHSQSAASFHALDNRFDANLPFRNEKIQLRDGADAAVSVGFQKEAAGAEVANRRQAFRAGTGPVNANALPQLNSGGKSTRIDGCFSQDRLHPPP